MTPNSDVTTPERGSAALPNVALRLFDEHGFENVTTEQIAEAAGVTQRTFFRHYPTKVDVLLANSSERTNEFVNRLYGQPPELGVVEALLATIVADEEANPATDDDLTRIRVFRRSESLVASLRGYESLLEQYFVDWLAQRTGHDATSLEIRTMAAVLVAARRVVMEEWAAQGASVRSSEIAEQVLRFLPLELSTASLSKPAMAIRTDSTARTAVPDRSVKATGAR